MSILSKTVIKRTATFASAFVLAVSTLTAALPFVLSSEASALSFTTVNPGDSAWTTADTRLNGEVNYVADADTAFGTGALQLKTGANVASQDKANIMHYFGTAVDLDTVTGPINYSTKQISASFAAGLPSYQIPVLLDGTAPSFTTLVYEPYVDQGNAAVANGVWQNWNVGAGKLWSSRNLPAYSIVGSQGSTTYTLDYIKANFPNAVALGFGVNVGSNNPFWDTRVDAVTFNGDTYDFEPFAVPACTTADNTNFENFSNGSVNGQNGWESTGPFDQAVVTNNYGINSFGCKSLRISNSVTSGSFGDQTFSYSTANEAGEVDSTNGGKSGGVRKDHFEAQFDIASTQAAVQVGQAVSVSPDRGDGSRMSYIRFLDGLNGIEMYFVDVQATGFEETYIGILPRPAAHTIKFVIDYKDGASNDVVQIFVDGVLRHTGTSWEDYYRFDPESAAEQTPRTSDSLIFRTSGTAVPANAGKGFLFDNVVITTSDNTVIAPEQPGNGGGNEGGNNGGTPNPVVSVVTPAITSPATVLGVDSDSSNDGQTDVEGANDSKSVDEQKKDAVNGLLFGIAWYWWLLILAILGGAGWWIVGAIRRRNADN